MQNSEFEKQVQEKMEELKFTPADAVWDKVEAALPEEKKRRWIIFLLFFIVAAGGALLWWNNSYKAGKKITIANTDTNRNIFNKPLAKNIQSVNENADKLKAAQKNITPVGDTTAALLQDQLSHKIKTAARTKIHIKNALAADDTLNTKEAFAKIKKSGNTKTRTTALIKAPQQFSEDQNVAALDTTNINKDNADPVSITNVAVINDSTAAITKVTLPDSVFTNKKDTTETQKLTVKNIRKLKWQYGIEMAAGTFNIKNDLFSSNAVYGTSALYGSVGGVPVTQPVRRPNKPLPGLAINAGFYLQRKITSAWQLKSGIHYTFLANRVRVGDKVDTATNFNFDVNKSIATSGYYREGNSVLYKNNSHLVEIPLLLQYHFATKLPLFAEAGPGVAFLIHSNALVYNTSSQVYISSDEVYNKVSLSVKAGIGITPGFKAKQLFTTGISFSYGVGSLVKSSFGRQHAASALIYVRMPLKK